MFKKSLVWCFNFKGNKDDLSLIVDKFHEEYRTSYIFDYKKIDENNHQVKMKIDIINETNPCFIVEDLKEIVHQLEKYNIKDFVITSNKIEFIEEKDLVSKWVLEFKYKEKESFFTCELHDKYVLSENNYNYNIPLHLEYYRS